jgi:hypothetical protein
MLKKLYLRHWADPHLWDHVLRKHPNLRPLLSFYAFAGHKHVPNKNRINKFGRYWFRDRDEVVPRKLPRR